jgi:hypothetical protein
VDDGDGVGVKPVAATACGVALDDGSAGAVEAAATDDSDDDLSVFHQAQRGPDWQPARPTAMLASITAWMANDLMAWAS